MSDLFCFGCQRSAGHYWWLTIDGYRTPLDPQKLNPEVPEAFRYVDGVDEELVRRREQQRAYEAQNGRELSRKLVPFLPNDKKQGSAKLTVIEGWTYLAWWDYLVDRRGGSNSGVLMKGEHSFEKMSHVAKAMFGKRAEGLVEEK